jgi:hypothetical protein
MENILNGTIKIIKLKQSHLQLSKLSIIYIISTIVLLVLNKNSFAHIFFTLTYY